MSADLVARYSKPVPRYTSYPTAPHFHTGVDSATYARWLGELPVGTPLSIYVHIPFCDRLCWFCGCHTKQVQRYDPIASYLPSVHRELETVAGLIGGRGEAVALHLGGGSPSMLSPGDLEALAAAVRRHFPSERLEFSVEIDPNDMDDARCDAIAAAGVTRASIGVQDFDPKVQQAINRIQTFEQTSDLVQALRQRNVGSVNLDVLYGLPHQTVASVQRTVELALSMRPDRLALFGYAHVPWMKKHQRLIDETVLPDAAARLEQAQAAASLLRMAGYQTIGIDHFALPSDPLAIAAREGKLHRNFQGYTTDRAPALIGFGASSIGSLPQGYVQNITATGEYQRQVAAIGLAVARGFASDDEDRTRGWVIEQLMCNFAVPLDELRRRFGAEADPVLKEMSTAALYDADGLVSMDQTRFAVTERGRPFVRSIASAFDAYLTAGPGRHSVGV